MGKNRDTANEKQKHPLARLRGNSVDKSRSQSRERQPPIQNVMRATQSIPNNTTEVGRSSRRISLPNSNNNTIEMATRVASSNQPTSFDDADECVLISNSKLI